MQSVNVNLGGVTRVPDDTMAQNGDLALALNLAADGDGLKMLEKPMPMFQLRQGETVLCVHQNDGYKHYITSYDGSLWWGTAPASLVTPPPVWSPTELGVSDANQATVMGNTVITQGSKMEYWLWDEGTGAYKPLGQRPPMAKLRFGLQSELKVYPGMTTGGNLADPAEFLDAMYWEDCELPYVRWNQSDTHFTRDRMYEPENRLPPSDVARASGSGYVDGQGNLREGMEGMWSLNLKGAIGSSVNSQAKIDEFVGKLTDWVMAYMNTFMAQANENRKFVLPFFVRYCYEMYDGSQVMQSDPVLLVPNCRAPQFVLNGRSVYAERFAEASSEHNKVGYLLMGRLWGFMSQLMYSVDGNSLSGLRDWKDLISGIGIYITAPIYTYDQDGKVYGWKEMHGSDWLPHKTYGKYNGSNTESRLSQVIAANASASAGTPALYEAYDSDHMVPWLVMRVPELSTGDIRRRVTEATQYYKLASISYDDIIKWMDEDTWPSNTAVKINKDVLSTLTNRRQLMSDYTGMDEMSAGVQYVYNRRLHIANVTRHLAAPLDYWTQVPMLGAASAISVPEAVEVVQTASHVLVNDGSVACENHSPYWLYNRTDGARAIGLDFGSDGKKRYQLTELDSGGGYWLSSLLWPEDGGSILDDTDTVESIASLPAATGGIVSSEGEVWTSNAENPFVFQAGNVNQVGDGIIRALRAAVAPLAEDQHGYAPMYVFTSQGIWAMTHSKDGTPAAIDHVCGDIITEGTEPLSVGQSCLVMTGRGLLELTGRRVSNVSAKIDGEFALTDMAHYDGAQGLVGLAWPQLPDVVDNFKSPVRGQSCRMSYDYQHQRVYVWLSRGGWVLNLRTGLWTQTAQSCVQAINAYPDCEFVTDDGINTGSSMVRFYGVMGYYGGGRYDRGLATTRPIKLSEHLAKLREVAVRGFVNTDLQGNDAQVWTVVHGSRNWHDYGLVGDNQGDRVTRLGGSAYRSHVVSVLLRDPTASVSRLVVTADEEQSNRLR